MTHSPLSIDDVREAILAVRKKPYTVVIEKPGKKKKVRYREKTPWRIVAKSFPGVHWATLNKIVTKKDYEPDDPGIRRKLGMAIYKPAPACAECGEVHVQKRCPNKPKTPRKNWVSLYLGEVGDELELILELTPTERVTALIEAAEKKKA